jgi:5'-methylthioinosine phosphorylase
VAKFGLIVGSGALQGSPDWDFSWAEEGGRETAYGEASAPLRRGTFGGHEVFALARHGLPHRFAPHAVNYRANVRLLADAGVQSVIALNTVGGISEAAVTEALLVPEQIIDYTWGRALSFNADDDVRHIDFSEPYDRELRTLLLAAAADAGVGAVDGGVMGVTQGPRLETAAEIQRMARDGCAMVGMTGMPEAVLAREIDLPLASLAMVVNPAAGLADEVIDMEDIRRASANAMAKAARLVRAFLEGFQGL